MAEKKLLEHREIIKRRKPVFLRTDWYKISVLGKGRKKKQKWRKPKGRHNKMREKKKGGLKMPSIGYRSPKKIRGTINGLIPKLVYNLEDLKKVDSGNDIVILGRIGKRKKIAVVKKALEMNLKIHNLDKKVVEEIEKKQKEREEGKKKEEKQEKGGK